MKMTAYEETVVKIRELPEPLIQEVSDFIDFLQMKRKEKSNGNYYHQSRWALRRLLLGGYSNGFTYDPRYIKYKI
jgi:hypothetical protein